MTTTPVAQTDELDAVLELASLMLSFAKSAVVKAVLELRIPDILANAGGQLTVNEIAAELPSKTVQLEYLARIMTFASSVNLFAELSEGNATVVEPEQGQRRFGLTPLSSRLVIDHSANPRASFGHMAQFQLCRISTEPWMNLSHAVLSGTQPFQLTHGRDLWEIGEADPEWGRLFNNGMAANSFRIMGALMKAYKGFEGVKHLVDVGGGLGASLTTIIQAHPDIQGINFDLPHVIANAPEIPGVKHVGGDMFKFVPEGDAIFIKGVLHDWGDEECIKILKNCSKALPQSGKLIILEIVLGDPKNGDLTYIMDIMMLAHTPSGKERTAPQWQRILKASGFERVDIIAVSSTLYAIEGYKS